MSNQLPTQSTIQTPEGFDLDRVVTLLSMDWLQAPRKPAEKEPEMEDSVDESHQSGAQEHSPEQPQPAKRPESRAEESDNTASASENNAESTAQPSPEPSIDRSALALAFFGWDKVSDGTMGLVECHACFRRLGLWLYKPKENGDPAVYSDLDVTGEHMDYCPWVNGQAQSGTGKPTDKPENLHSGWELLAQAVRVKHRRRLQSTASLDTLRTDVRTTSIDEPMGDEESKKASDREWWAKIRRVKQMLNIKAPKRHKATGSR